MSTHIVAAAIAIAIALGASSAHAQPSKAYGQPMPDPSLALGTIIVRVVDGGPPVAYATVQLAVNGATRTATADDTGRVSFDNIAGGAQVRVSVTIRGRQFDSEQFLVPHGGGVRVLLGIPPPDPRPPTTRELSGQPVPSPTEPAGTLIAHVVYNDLADPAVNLPVTLVGYAADERVTVATQKTDRDGKARFTGLDRTGATAYFAMTLLPRGRGVDRLVAQPAMLDARAGVLVRLSGETRKSTAAAIDDLPSVGSAFSPPPAPVPKGKLDVVLSGVPEATSVVTLIDAASGKPVASATVTAPDTHAVFDVAARSGAVLYAETKARGERIRSHPFLATAGGTAVALYALPRVLVKIAINAEPNEPVLAARMSMVVRNHTWFPQRITELPLPRGFTDAALPDADADVATLTATGIQPSRPLPPGGREFRVAFSLPAVTDKVRWDLELPYGVFDGSMMIAREDGMTVDVSSGTALTIDDDAFRISPISIQPKQSMVMTIGMPKLSPAEKALARACSTMYPDRKTPLRDRPAPGLIAPQLDGKPLRLASLRGKLVVVYFTGTWNPVSRTELPTFQKAAAAIPDLVVVLVSSNAKADDVRALIGPTPPPSLRAVLDPPLDPDKDPLGPITRSWKVPLIPESFVIDRGGTVRLYFPNTRDWGTPEAIACLKAVK